MDSYFERRLRRGIIGIPLLLILIVNFPVLFFLEILIYLKIIFSKKISNLNFAAGCFIIILISVMKIFIQSCIECSGMEMEYGFGRILNNEFFAISVVSIMLLIINFVLYKKEHSLNNFYYNNVYYNNKKYIYAFIFICLLGIFTFPSLLDKTGDIKNIEIAKEYTIIPQIKGAIIKHSIEKYNAILRKENNLEILNKKIKAENEFKEIFGYSSKSVHSRAM